MNSSDRLDFEAMINASSNELYKAKFSEIRKLFDLTADGIKPDSRDKNIKDEKIFQLLIDVLPESISHLEEALRGVKLQGLRHQIMFAFFDFAYAARVSAGYFPPSLIAEQVILRKKNKREHDRLTKQKAEKKAPLHKALRRAIKDVLNERDMRFAWPKPGLKKEEITEVRKLTAQAMNVISLDEELRSDQTIRIHAQPLIEEWLKTHNIQLAN